MTDVEMPDVKANAPAPAPAAPKRFTFRLDDGTVLQRNGDESVVMKPSEAWRAGYLTEEHLLRAQALLCEVHAKLPDEVDGLKSISTSTKRSMDSVLEINQATSAKRSRSEQQAGAPYMPNGNGIHSHATEAVVPAAPVAAPPAAISPPPAPVAPAVAAPPPDFVRGCKALIHYLIDKVLGPINAPIFRDPVNPKFVPDYYNIVKTPICMQQVMHKLDTLQYSTPHEFYADMTLLFNNCVLYNGTQSVVGQLGVKLEQAFDLGWSKLPFSASVPLKPPRQLGGLHKAGRSAQGAAVAKPKAPLSGGGPRRGKVGRPPGVVRSKSVNSYQAALQQLPPEKKQELADAMQNEMVMETKMEGVVDILQAHNELPMNEEGEVELDINQLSAPVMWKLYEFVVGGPVAPPAPGAAPAAPAAGFQIDGEDSDYNPEEEDDD